MKKRFLALMVILILTLTACSKSKDTTNPKGESNDAENIQSIEDKGDDGEKEKTESQDKPEEPEVPENKVNILPEMSSAEAREINIFLSNFSEAFYDPSSGYFGASEAKIDFAFRHVSINDYAKVIGEDNYMGISAENADTILKRFFGETVPHETPKNSKNWIYKDGNFLTVAAAGETYADFSIATEVKERKEGNYQVLFNVYTDPSIGGGDVITDKSVYSLNDSQAAEKYKLIGHGIAVLKPKTHNGEATYELVSYVVEYN